MSSHGAAARQQFGEEMLSSVFTVASVAIPFFAFVGLGCYLGQSAVGGKTSWIHNLKWYDPRSILNIFAGTRNLKLWRVGAVFHALQIVFMFCYMALERPGEIEANMEKNASRHSLTAAMALQLSGPSEEALELIRASVTLPVDTHNWNVYGSHFFTLTIATTIGYGSFAPQTAGGRLFTIVSCLLSIAVGANFIGQVGERMVHMFEKFVVRRFICLQKVAYSPRQRAENLMNFRAPDITLDELLTQFSAMDLNGDGRVDKSELAKALALDYIVLTDAELHGIFDEADLNSNGQLGMKECAAAVETALAGRPRFNTRKLQKTLSAMDTDGDGCISKSELHDAMLQSGLDLSDAVLTLLFDNANENGEGDLTYREAAEAIHLYVESMPDFGRMSEVMLIFKIVAIGVVPAIILSGSIVFSLMTQSTHDEYNFLTSVYFVVVTLTTIGLGDKAPAIPRYPACIPGTVASDSEPQGELPGDCRLLSIYVVWTIFIYIGLGTMATCIGALAELIELMADQRAKAEMDAAIDNVETEEDALKRVLSEHRDSFHLGPGTTRDMTTRRHLGPGLSRDGGIEMTTRDNPLSADRRNRSQTADQSLSRSRAPGTLGPLSIMAQPAIDLSDV